MECSDLLSVVVRAILNIGSPATPAEILAQAQSMCTQPITLAQIEAACALGTARGVLLACMLEGDPQLRYEIRADMLQQRWDNDVYWQLVQATQQAGAPDPGASDGGSGSDNPLVFFDRFNGKFDCTKWYVARKQFGVNNNGVVPANVVLNNDYLVLRANGDLYTGPVVGVSKVGQTYPYNGNTTRVGAGIFTQQYFGSGRFEVRARAMPYYGAYSAFFTFYFAQVGLDITNHEIDIEMPGRPGAADPADFNFLLGTTRVTDVDATTNYMFTPMFAQNDGLFHTYKIDWYAGSDYTPPRVDFYVDNNLVGSNTQFVPNIAGRFWVSTWFPDVVAGNPNFVTGELWVDWVRITPNPSPNDRYLPETFPNDGIAEPGEAAHLGC